MGDTNKLNWIESLHDGCVIAAIFQFRFCNNTLQPKAAHLACRQNARSAQIGTECQSFQNTILALSFTRSSEGNLGELLNTQAGKHQGMIGLLDSNRSVTVTSPLIWCDCGCEMLSATCCDSVHLQPQHLDVPVYSVNEMKGAEQPLSGARELKLRWDHLTITFVYMPVTHSCSGTVPAFCCQALLRPSVQIHVGAGLKPGNWKALCYTPFSKKLEK